MEENKSEAKAMVQPLLFNVDNKIDMPVNKLNVGKGIVEWGGKLNSYGEFLVNLYESDGASVHTKCVNKKVNLICGKGVLKDGIDPSLKAFIDKNNMDELLYKITLDFEIFNGYAIEVIYSKGGSLLTMQHIPFQNLLFGIKSNQVPYEHVLYSANWAESRKEFYRPEIIPLFNANNRTGKQIFYYRNYSPNTKNIYPTPSYINALAWIKTQYLIGNFHFAQAKNHYAPSYVLNLIGNPTVEEKDEFARGFKREFGGVDNTSKIMITYSDGQTQPTLIPIQGNDSDKRFKELMPTIKQEIVDAHLIPMQLVMLYPGQLGSNDERDFLNKEFQNDYIKPRQMKIENGLNIILAQGGLPNITINPTDITNG